MALAVLDYQSERTTTSELLTVDNWTLSLAISATFLVFLYGCYVTGRVSICLVVMLMLIMA